MDVPRIGENPAGRDHGASRVLRRAAGSHGARSGVTTYIARVVLLTSESRGSLPLLHLRFACSPSNTTKLVDSERTYGKTKSN